MLPVVGTSISVHEGIDGHFRQTTLETIKLTKRRRRSLEEKRRIVEETLESGASVARVARRHAVNANQVFYWRKKYREGRLGQGPSSKLLPVTLSMSDSTCGKAASWSSAVGSLEIKLSKGTIRKRP